MTNKKITVSIVSIATGVALLGGVAIMPAYAQTTAGSVPTTTTTKAQKAAAQLTKIITRSDTEIVARVTALNALLTRVNAMVNVSAAEKATIATEVQTNTSGLNTLKAKIDADTDAATALTDSKSVLGSFRIYALIMPQGYIAAAADRVDTVVGMLTTISTKLQTRITADQTAGKDVTTIQAALTDMNARIADATAQSGMALSGIASLVPDQGNKTLMQSNTTALKAARANIKKATSDLQTARKDANTITKGLKTLGQ